MSFSYLYDSDVVAKPGVKVYRTLKGSGKFNKANVDGLAINSLRDAAQLVEQFLYIEYGKAANIVQSIQSLAKEVVDDANRNAWEASHPSCDGKTVLIDGRKYKLTEVR